MILHIVNDDLANAQLDMDRAPDYFAVNVYTMMQRCCTKTVSTLADTSTACEKYHSSPRCHGDEVK